MGQAEESSKSDHLRLEVETRAGRLRVVECGEQFYYFVNTYSPQLSYFVNNDRQLSIVQL